MKTIPLLPLRLTTGAFLAALTLSCHAAITVFENRADFNAASGPVVVETFTEGPHFPIKSGVLNSNTDEVVEFYTPIRPGDILPGASYIRPTDIGTPFALNIDAFGQGMQGGYLNGFHGTSSDPGLTIRFDAPVSAFGFDTNLFMGPRFRVRFTHGSEKFSETFPVASYDYRFYGFTSDARDISEVLVEGFGDELFRFGLDNFTYTSPVPDIAPLTMWLTGVGLTLCIARRRKERIRSAATSHAAG